MLCEVPCMSLTPENKAGPDIRTRVTEVDIVQRQPAAGNIFYPNNVLFLLWIIEVYLFALIQSFCNYLPLALAGFVRRFILDAFR